MDNEPTAKGRWITQCPDPERWAERIERKSEPDGSGCLLWTGALGTCGYGKFSASHQGQRVYTGAHRAAWLSQVGDIPEGLVLDHLCRNPRCVNVEHLEPVTPLENSRRGDQSTKKGRGCARHGREDGYFRMGTDGYVIWSCRPCMRERGKRWRQSQTPKR